jgi:PAS domain S-box-containing protein
MKIKILIIEHDSREMELIQQELKKGSVHYISEKVKTDTEFTNAIHNFKPDIILSSDNSPIINTFKALSLKEKLIPQTPFIFVSESIDLENTEILIRNGVTELVLKERLFTLSDKIQLLRQEIDLKRSHALLRESEEKRAELLSQNESKYSSLFESSMDAILLTTKDGQILSVNAAACEVFKMTEKELCSIKRKDIIENTDSRLQPLIEEYYLTGRVKGEITFKRKDGSTFPGEFSSVEFIDTSGHEKTSLTIRDITLRKQAEDKQQATSIALQQALNDLNSILDSSLDVICSIDENGKFVSINAASEYIWGYKPVELIGAKYMDYVLHDDINKTITANTKIRSGSPVTTFENHYIHKDGSSIPTLWSSRWDDKNKLFYSTAKNATEKKKLERAFEIERQRFIDLYLQAPSCMGILKGPNHIYEMANPLYLSLIDKKDIIGKTVKEVLPEFEAQGVFDFLDTVYQTGETFSANEMLLKFDFEGNGKLVDKYLNFICQAHRNNDGGIDGILFFVIDVTEQVISRKKIEESLLRYSSLINQASDAICFIDTSMKIIEVNYYACQKLGYSRIEFLQLSITDFFLEEDLQVNPLKIDALKGGRTIRDERRIKRKDGALIDVELSSKKLKDGNILLFVRDISQHKKAQVALMESEQKYRQIVETAQEGIWLVDENHKTTFVNNKMCQILEYTQNEMIGKEIFSFMDEKGQQIAAGLMQKKKEGYSDQRHFKYISKSGKEIWASVASNPFISENGSYKGSMAMVTDITEIKKAQQNLKENEKKYRYLFENNPMPMWITDFNTLKFLDVNKMAIQKYGYSREEFLSMTAFDIRPEIDRESFKQLYKPFECQTENFFGGIWNHQRKNRTVFPVEIFAHKIMYEGNAAVLVLSNDITDRKKAELNLEKRNIELIKTNSELDRFVYSVSHDLRSPLTSILGLLSFIEEESKETDTLEHAKMIRNSINRLDKFIKNILSYSRNNRTGLDVKLLSLQQTTIEIVDALHSTKMAKGIDFEIDIQEIIPFYSDRLRFNTILENLISNAINYQKKDQTNSYIKITGVSDHEKLELKIADNGIGISPAHHSKIYEMFFRLSGKTEGSGIGLYIVKETIEKLAGSIQIQSELGTGTTFIITLKNLKP